MVAEEIGIRDLCPPYGLSEASPNVCITDWRDLYEKRLHGPAAAGRLSPVSAWMIFTSVPAPFQRGEICVRGYSVMKGYYQQPEETARTVDADEERAVESWGERELLVFPDRRLRTREFADEAGSFARGLLRLGVERGDHVAVWQDQKERADAGCR